MSAEFVRACCAISCFGCEAVGATDYRAHCPASVGMTIPYPHISPLIFSLGPIAIRWYGVMYFLGYAVGGLSPDREYGDDSSR